MKVIKEQNIRNTNCNCTYKIYEITPTDHTSTSLPYGCCASTSGAENMCDAHVLAKKQHKSADQQYIITTLNIQQKNYI